jgi:uncharacterized protein YqjF (DUF2071 family)
MTQIAGYQSWKRLAFLHWRLSSAALQSLLPADLTIEEFDGSAWLGLVPFSMERIRPWWSPPVPGISWFLETNVRTYVRHRSGATGVWFFSLDANSRIAVSVARRFWSLPYFHAAMTLDCRTTARETQILYTGCRTAEPRAEYSVDVRVDPQQSPTPASPGTLEHFLVERYLLFAQDPSGSLFSGQVFHPPYQIVPAICEVTRNSLTVQSPWIGQSPDHAVFSQGVDVSVSRLTRL